jgi:hypothetical protein
LVLHDLVTARCCGPGGRAPRNHSPPFGFFVCAKRLADEIASANTAITIMQPGRLRDWFYSVHDSCGMDF